MRGLIAREPDRTRDELDGRRPLGRDGDARAADARPTSTRCRPSGRCSSSRSTATSRWPTPARWRSRGVATGTPDPPGGVILRDAAGEPTGILHDAAIALLEHEMPAPTAEQDAAALRAAHEELVRSGVTSYMDASAFEPELAAVAALSDAGGLLVRPSARSPSRPSRPRTRTRCSRTSTACARRTRART